MERFVSLWHWCIEHWKSSGITVAGAVGVGTWILSQREKSKAARRAKAERAVDSQVIQALQNHNFWKGQRPFTGPGDLLVRAAEIAQVLSLDCDAVTDSLERLEAQGRVRKAGGTSENPAPYWHILHR